MDTRYIKSPNLPENRVKLVIIGDLYRNILKKPLNDLGIDVCTVDEGKNLLYPVRYHADMMMSYIGSGKFVAMEDTANELRRKLTVGATVYDGKSCIKEQYPYDIAYNILQIGRKYFHNTPYTDSIVKELLFANGLDSIYVRQGYSKCSACVVDEKSVITSDKGIYNALISNGFNALLISEGYIDLDGYDYGFIGGCSGKISKNEIAFTGRFDDHPDHDRIIEFLEMHDVRAVILTEKRIFDVGSIIPVKEESGNMT